MSWVWDGIWDANDCTSPFFIWAEPTVLLGAFGAHNNGLKSVVMIWGRLRLFDMGGGYAYLIWGEATPI
jgi:hypothetical protein